MFSFYGGGGGFNFGGIRARKASKPKKKAKDNWFERLSLDQNKQLCKAAKLRYGGSKKELIGRLLGDEQTNKFAWEGKVIGMNVESIKALCRGRNLQVSGNKFDLVLRVLHCDNGTTPEGMTLKRAAAPSSATTNATVAKKPRKTPALSAKRVYTRVQKKIEAVTQKKYQTHWGSKSHSCDVYDLVAEILYADIEKSDEKYLTNDPKFALSIAEAACTSLTDNFETMERKGYDDSGSWSSIDSSLRRIVEAAKPLLTADEKEAAAEWIEAMYDEANEHCLVEDSSFEETCQFLRSDGDGRKDEEADERKPAAKPVVAAAFAGSKPAAAPMKTEDEALSASHLSLHTEKSSMVKENNVNLSMPDDIMPPKKV
ncbi:hypothetical protein ACHAXR_002886 [Thalassiosira sp. AJA248-18]